MKKCLFGLTIFSLLFYMSCSNDADENINAADLQTIKSLVTKIEDETVWSVELEKERLSKNLASDSENLAGSLVLTKDNSRILKAYREAVYPSFSDFGSLNISSMEYKNLSSAEEICSSLCNLDEDKLFSYFSSNYRYNYIFFARELKKGWKDNFGKAFPEAKVSEAGEAAENEEKTVIKLFDHYIMGEAFYSNNLIQIPARFYCNMGFVDVTLYMNPSQEKTVFNMKIVRWEKNG